MALTQLSITDNRWLYWPFQIVEAWAIFLFWTGHLDVSCDERAAALLRSLTQEYWILFWVRESLSQNWLSSVGHTLLPRLPFLLPMFIFQFASVLPYLVILPFGKVWLMTICGLPVFLKFASIYESKIRITDYNKKAMKKFIHSNFFWKYSLSSLVLIVKLTNTLVSKT